MEPSDEDSNAEGLRLIYNQYCEPPCALSYCSIALAKFLVENGVGAGIGAGAGAGAELGTGIGDIRDDTTSGNRGTPIRVYLEADADTGAEGGTDICGLNRAERSKEGGRKAGWGGDAPQGARCAQARLGRPAVKHDD